MPETKDAVQTGIEHESEIPGDWADVYAYVDDGEFARVWCIRRTSDYEVAVSAFNVEAGVPDRDGTFGKKYFEVDPDADTDAWAKEYAENHRDAIDIARGNE
jgi:hypothetical protein